MPSVTLTFKERYKMFTSNQDKKDQKPQDQKPQDAPQTDEKKTETTGNKPEYKGNNPGGVPLKKS